MSMFKNFDFYPKLSDEFKVKTLHGGMISIAAICTIVILLIAELSDYLTTDINDMLYVDVNRNELLTINFDMTFPSLPCVLMSLDAMDLSGNHQIGVSHHVTKQALDVNGRPVGEKTKELLGNTLSKSDVDRMNENKATAQGDDPNGVQAMIARVSAPGYCGPCYGAGAVPNQCCQTCEDVKNAYRARGWSIPPLTTIEQCIASGQTMEEGGAQLAAKEGCHITGYLEVNKVAGNFHFAPGKSFQHQNMHIHDLALFPQGKFNVSHIINTLSFGRSYPGIINPLDGESRHIGDQLTDDMGAAGMYQYYTKVVPTQYTYLNGTTVSTNQFSVTEHYRTLNQRDGGGLPGVFFFYDLSPIMVKFNEERKSFFHFITQLCAILGGVFTVSGMIDRLLFAGINAVQKQRAGKLI